MEVGGHTVDEGELASICDRYGVARLEVFGSASRGDEGPASDIDLLYTLRPGARLGWSIGDLDRELSALFGRPVDLVSPRALHSRLREAILRDAKALYIT